jgi:branched-chain amino acid transport system substrate-binding protein
VLVTCACSSQYPAAWTAAYTKLAGEAPGPYSAEAFDAANVIIQAIAKSKTVTRTNVLAQVKKTNYVGITKTIKFNSAGDVAGTAIFVSKVENGKLVQLGLE